jgi:hypothetical protein
VDLREINKACQTRKMKMETLRSLRLIAKPGDHWVSFDLKDGFYSLAIAPQDRECFTVNLDGKLLQFCALPMGWSLSPFVFQKLTEVFTDHLRDPESSTPSPASQDTLGPKALKRWRRRRRRLTGARLLPFVDDFALFEVSYDETLKLKVYTFTLLTGLGLKIHPTKGHFDPILIGEHLGMIIDMKVGQFVAPTAKLKQIATLAKTLLCRAAAHKRWVSVKTLCLLSRKGTVPALGHSRGQILSTGTSRRDRLCKVLVRDRAGNAATQTRSRVVDARPGLQERRPPSGSQSRMHIYIATRAATGGELC